MMTSPDFWVILRDLTARTKSAPRVFEILEGIIAGSPPIVTADNYDSAVKLLNDFASAGSVGATGEQTQDKKARKGQQKKDARPKVDAAVARGVKAVMMIYTLTSRIHSLMQQSHLESREGRLLYALLSSG